MLKVWQSGSNKGDEKKMTNMFEKEAEEILNNHCDCELLPECISGIRCRCSDFEEMKKLLLEGIEFGYNKANEWHYVKDGDYPKEKGNYLVAWKRTHHVEEYGKWGFDVDLFNADEGYFEGVGDYVIAWKEIVLPKEIE